MKSKSHLEKWGSIGLGLVCLILVVNLVFRGGFKTGSAKPVAPAPRPAPAARGHAGVQRPLDDLARYNPAIRMDLLEQIAERPEIKIARDPFEFEAHQPPPKAQNSAAAAPASQPAAPQPPPPPPLKAVGYTEKTGGVREAIVSLDDQLFVIHEGETFAKRFRVLKITPNQVEVNDETTQQDIRLPFS
jgi:hypothetical protein